MKKEFLINIVLLIGINLLIKPFYLFGIDRTVQNVTGPDAYGLYWALFNFTFIFQFINDFGLQNFTNKFISQSRASTKKYIGHLLAIKFLAGVIFLLAVVAFALVLNYPLSFFTLLIPIALNQILVSFIYLFRANLAGLGHYRRDSLVSVLDKFLMILICGYLLWYAHDISFTISHFIFAQSAALVLTLVIVGLMVRFELKGLGLRWHWATVVTFLRKSAPYALVFVLTTLYSRVDGVMLERLLPNGANEAGIYAGGYRLLEAGNMFAFLFAGLLLPMFSYQLKSKENISGLFSTAIKMMWVLTISATVLIFFYREDLVLLLYTHANEYWGQVLGILILSFSAMGISYICGSLLLAGDQVRKLNFIYLGAMLINVLTNWLVIPQYGALGAAYTTLITQSIVAVLSLNLVRFRLAVTLGLTLWGGMLIFLGLCLLVLFLISTFFSNLLWFWQFIIIGLLFATIGLALGYLPLRLLFRQEENHS